MSSDLALTPNLPDSASKNLEKSREIWKNPEKPALLIGHWSLVIGIEFAAVVIGHRILVLVRFFPNDPSPITHHHGAVFPLEVFSFISVWGPYVLFYLHSRLGVYGSHNTSITYNL